MKTLFALIVLLVAGCNVRVDYEYRETMLPGSTVLCCLERCYHGHGCSLLCGEGLTIHQATNYIQGDVCHKEECDELHNRCVDKH